MSLFLVTLTAVSAEPTRTLSLSCEFTQPAVDRDQGKVRVTIPGCANLDRVGEPSLPFRIARILLPPGFRVTRVTVQSPAPSVVLPDKVDLERGPAFSARRPLQQAQLVSVQRMLGCDIALVRLIPVEYQAANAQLQFSPRLDVTLTLAPAGTKPAGFPTRGQAQARARVAAWVDNPALLSEYEPAGGPDLPPAHDYLLITRESLAPSFQPLVEQKQRAGLSVKVETMEKIVASQAGRDAPEKLRNYIREACVNWGVQYVLLGGDVGTVPCRYAYVLRRLAERDCLVPCDLYFACLDGSWNRDGDARWGELTDGEQAGDVDLLAEVDLGRAPVDTPAEAANFVEKTVRYQQLAPRDVAPALLLGAFLEQGSAQGGAMFDSLRPSLARFSVRSLDDRPFRVPQWRAADVLRELNAGPRLVLYSGHADQDAVMRLDRADLDALTNKEPFLFCSVGCNAGQFDNDQFSPDSIGEELVKRHPHGAFAAILNSRLGWFDARQEWKYSGEFQNRFLDQLVRQGGSALGRVFQLARAELLSQVETSGATMTYRFCYYGLTLFGDPQVVFNMRPKCEGQK